jgi:hypothetical protein
MHRFLYVGTEALMEILGSVEPSSPNPRRNTSKEFFDVLRRGDKVDTCLRFVSSLSPLLGKFLKKVDTKWRQRGYMSLLSNHLSLMNG